MRQRLRRALAEWLRRTAARVDGRWTVEIALPPGRTLSNDRMADAVMQGVRVIRRCVDDELLAQNIEAELQRTHPELWP